MGPPRECVEYAPVEPYYSKSTETPEFVIPEERCLLRETDGQVWLNTMVSPDKQTCVGAKPAEQNQQTHHKEPRISWQQVMGCLSANAFNFAVGVGMAFTSALIPALQAEDSDIKPTPALSAWLASSIPLTVPVGAIISGYLMEHLGRLAAVQVTIIPFCIAWIVIATASNYTALLIGRIIMGIMFGVGCSASTVLITETALKNYRGSLLCTGITFASFGIFCEYTIGAMLDWRTSAWVSLASPLIPFLFVCIFTAESPVWLKSRGRIEKAKKASLYYYGDPNYVVLPTVEPQTPPPLQNDIIDVEKMADKQKKESIRPNFSKQVWMLLSLPSGYKPFIILSVVFLLQQWSGIYITLYYAVTFFQEAGSSIDPYIATIMVGAMRFLACGMTVFLLGGFRRRVLMLVSAIGMAVCMAASAYSTGLALVERDGGPESFFPSWFPVSCTVIYILAASVGLQTIPWTMTAELFPQRVRGAAQSVNMVVVHLFMFATLQAYPTMDYYLGGAVGVQYFFAASSVLAAVIVWIFFPETHGKTLSEIEDYFVHNTIYLGHKK